MHKGVKIGLGVGAGGLALVALTIGGIYAWAVSARAAVISTRYDIAPADIPVPWPLSEAEIQQLRADRAAAIAANQPPDPSAPPVDPATLPDPLAGVDLDAIAYERAVLRGKHLVQSRFGCHECHGADLAGGTMIDAPPMGALLGPNITIGGVTKGWTGAEWDRIVRHGVMSDGHTSVMPAEDYAMISDQELSDVIAYTRSFPPSDKVVPEPRYGPILNLLIATGQMTPAASRIDHTAARPKEPPPAQPDATFGAHIAQSCTGCHRADFSGGPIPGGDPSWPPAANLSVAGTDGWTFDEFDAALRKGQKRGGGEVPAPMPWQAYAGMTDVEAQALWAYISALAPKETGI